VSEKSVLIVDDDLLQVNVLSQILANEGYAIDVAANGLQAFEKIKEKKYSAVIVDYVLPYYNGDQLALMVKKYDPEAKIILITGYVLSLNKSRAKLFSRVLEKPFEATKLISALKELTGETLVTEN